ncbi:hypothetical protein KR054_003375 [Drosophila jambulina]|nr:hypothetical protein KR054_003375 [Drosophila jambulina]
MLRYPDYKKAFDLTTDAPAHGIGAVLSQEGRPITMISRTLRDREVTYATNERELLAIVWALAKLRHYLYAVKDINIFTDHQPLTFAVSESNPNAKIKRWKARIFYKPGKENLVAEALSPQQINVMEEQEAQSYAATIHIELPLTHTIETTDKPLNCFQNQITLEEARFPLKRSFILFENKRRFEIRGMPKTYFIFNGGTAVRDFGQAVVIGETVETVLFALSERMESFIIPLHKNDDSGENGVWAGYEDPDTAAIKAEYVKREGLGGIAVVDLSFDDFRGGCTAHDKYPILCSVKSKL